MISEVTIVRIDETAEASFALMRERKRFGIAIAAMIKTIITTISNSSSENPFSLRLIGCTEISDREDTFNAQPKALEQLLAHFRSAVNLALTGCYG